MKVSPFRALVGTRKLAIIVLGLMLFLYICFLILNNYQTQSNLRKTALEQLVQDTEKLAMTIGYFFSERKTDLENLSKNRSLSVFFENRALGMSMEYGLQASLNSIARQFDRFIKEKKFDGKRIYSRVVFVNANAQLFVESSPGNSEKNQEMDWNRFLTPDNPKITVTDESNAHAVNMIVSCPYFFKQKYAGQIISWIAPENIYDYFIQADRRDDEYTGLLSRQNRLIMLENKWSRPNFSDLPDFASMKMEKTRGFEATNQNGTKVDLITVKVPVKGTPFFLVRLLPTSSVLGYTSPTQLLMAMGALAVAFLGGAVVLFRIFTHNLVLRARFEEASKREQEIAAKNRQLEKEVDERKRADEALRESEAQKKAILDASIDVIRLVDNEMRIIWANKTTTTELKATPEQLVGSCCYEAVAGRDTPCPGCPTKKALKSGKAEHALIHQKELKGVKEETYWDDYALPIKNESGDIVNLIQISRNITDRKLAEDKLLESKANLSQAQQMAHIGNWNWNVVKNKISWSDELYRIVGLSPQQFDANYEAYLQCIHPDDLEFFKNITKKVLRDKKSYTVEYRIVRPNDDVRTVQELGEVTVDANGDPINLFGTVQDLTERKHEEEQYRTIIQTAIDGFWIVDSKGDLLDVNDAACMMLGYQSEELLKMHVSDIEAVETPDETAEHIQRSIEKGYDSFETQHRRKDGTIIDVQTSFQYSNLRGGVFIAFIRDISEQKRNERTLRESEERFRTVADFAYDWEYWVGPDGQLIYISPSCERITGYSPEEFVNDPGLLVKIVHSDDNSIVVKHIRQEEQREEACSFDFRIVTLSGEERWISHACQPVYGSNGRYGGLRASNRDISKRKQMEEELLKAKKLESLGVLAGGIAHDFNNLLTSVVGNISLARMEMKPGSKAFRNLVEAEKASIQTKELTARLITFSKGGGPVKETVSIGNLVKDSVDSSLKGSDIICRFSIPDDISPVEVDEEQMKQVIHNVVTNAQEAMAGQGSINVSCENVNIGEKNALRLKDGKYVKISLRDQGLGIPEEDFIKIFDPYFSTKEMGTQKGMGLGLAVSDSIVKQHDGLITVESELGRGTTLSIYLPASEKEIVEAAPVKKPVPEQHLSQGEKILVMDDEEMVRDVTNALLTHIGYKVEVAVEGVEAVEMYRKAMESENPFDMVILDLTSYIGMGGAETIKRLLEIDPDVRAIVATGYSNDPIISNFREHGFCGSLSKPFSMDELKTTLREVIAGE